MSPRTFAQYDADLLKEKYTGNIVLNYMHGKKMSVHRPVQAVRTPLVERRQLDAIPLDDQVSSVHIQSAK